MVRSQRTSGSIGHRPFVLSAVATLTILCLFARPATGQPDARQILERIDHNMTFETARMVASMTVRYREGDERTLVFRSWSSGADRSFLEFTEPARDAGSRFLRIEDSMWIFLPRVGKSVRIQGHMLRQGLMGSDFSYGDASENPSMVEDYEGTVEGTETIDGRPCWVLRLEGNRRDLTYPSQRIWVDQDRWVPLKEEWYARSGKLLKTAELGDVREVGERWYPFRITLDNALQADTSTTLQVLEVELGISIDDSVFTLRHLERGGR